MSRIRNRSRKTQPYRNNWFKSGNIILIVCEGSETEPNYFKNWKSRFRIASAHLKIFGKECDPDPLKVVKYAIKKRDEDTYLKFDQIWCVIDSDNHQTLKEAVILAKKNGFEIALSQPCFEFWYLLHYQYTTREFRTSQALKKYLEKFIKNYNAGVVPYDELYEKVNEAIGNAKKLISFNKENKRKSPSTDVHLLVNELLRLKQEKAKR